MDTSKEYIKMCDCPEIQGMIQEIIEADQIKRVETLRRFRDTLYSVIIPHCITPDVCEYDKNGKPIKKINLLNQDQVQEMMFPPNARVFNALERIREFCIELSVQVGYCKSMEQLWLAFYMHEKHKKSWDGKKWKA